MRKLFTLSLVLFFSISTTSIFAQAHLSGYDPLQMLIKFEPGTSEDSIDYYMAGIEAVELWISPITETRLWELENFQGVRNYYNDSTIDDIIGTIVIQDGRDDIDEVGLNFETKITPGDASGPQNGGQGNPNEDESLPFYESLCHKNIAKPGGINSGLRIAVLDTGNDSNFSGVTPDFEYNYITNSFNAIDPHGHGTTMTNLIATTFEANSIFKASDVEWDLRVTHDYNGIGDISDILLAMEQAAQAGADVINMSFSYLCTDSLVNLLFEESIAELETMNILINASAGNQANDNDGLQKTRAYPATYENYNIISVGAFNCFANDISSFSNWGEYSVDILAPGNEIDGFTFQPEGGVGGSSGVGGNGNGATGQNTNIGNGCSQATAITSGLALALGTYQSSWDYVEVKCAILKGAKYKNLSKDILTSGLIHGPRSLNQLVRGCYDIVDEPIELRGSGKRSRNGESPMTSKASVKLFPNPASEVVNIDISQFSTPVEIKLFNNLGQLVKSVQNQSEGTVSINIADLNQGLYMIKCESEEISISESVIITE